MALRICLRAAVDGRCRTGAVLVFEESGMDMSNGLRHLFQHRVKRRKGDTARLAARLAPLEEQGKAIAIDQKQSVGGVSQESGAIVIDRNNLQVPREMMEGSESKGLLGMEPVVLVILGFMLCFHRVYRVADLADACGVKTVSSFKFKVWSWKLEYKL